MKSELGFVVKDYDSYKLVRQDHKAGGVGIALYVRNTLDEKIAEKSNTTKTDKCNEPQPQPEYLIHSVQQCNSFHVLAAMVYRPRHVGLYANGLNEHLRSVSHTWVISTSLISTQCCRAWSYSPHPNDHLNF